MDILKRPLYKHLISLTVISIAIVLGIIYPFLPGQYEPFGITVSLLLQIFGIVGMLLVVVGIIWFAWGSNRKYLFAWASVITASLVAFVLCLVAMASMGRALALIMAVIWGGVLCQLIPKVKSLKSSVDKNINLIPLYLIVLPVVSLVSQLVLARPLTEWSRGKAIENARQYIADTESYHSKYGSYPVSLFAQWKDYYPDIVGVEKYHYVAQDSSYNLAFEQPRFFLDNFGAREWVVYNPTDQQKIYSHTSWFLILTPEELQTAQGWFAVHDAKVPHWKYFLFD